MAGLGWLGITSPEEYGGTGGSFLDLYPIYEEMGRFLVPSPHLDTVVVAGETILTAGTDAQRAARAARDRGRQLHRQSGDRRARRLVRSRRHRVLGVTQAAATTS